MATKRTTHRSSAGKKLYAVRGKTGSFKDIQTYRRAHGSDVKRKAKAELPKLIAEDCAVYRKRVAHLEAGLREIMRVAEYRTIPDRHRKMIDSCNETCLGECFALARKTLRGDPMPRR